MRARWKDPKTGENLRGTVLSQRISLFAGMLLAVIRCDDGKKRKVDLRLVTFWMDKVIVWRNALNGEIHYVVPVPDPKNKLETEKEIIERWASLEESKALPMFVEGTAERMPDITRNDLPPRQYREYWRWLNGGLDVYLPEACQQRQRELKSERVVLAQELALRELDERVKEVLKKPNRAAELREKIKALETLKFDVHAFDFNTADELTAYDPFIEFRK